MIFVTIAFAPVLLVAIPVYFGSLRAVWFDYPHECVNFVVWVSCARLPKEYPVDCGPLVIHQVAFKLSLA